MARGDRIPGYTISVLIFSLDTPGLPEIFKNSFAIRWLPSEAGGTVEMYSLTPSEHLEVVRAVVEEVHGKVSVIAGTGFNRQLATELARQSERARADGILALPLTIRTQTTWDSRYCVAIGAATPLGLFVYSRDWVNPSLAWVDQA